MFQDNNGYAIFVRIGKIATEEVILHLLCTQWMPLYGREACPMKNYDLNYPHFTVDRFFMKLFWTCDVNIVKSCQIIYFYFNLPGVLLKNHAEKIERKYNK